MTDDLPTRCGHVALAGLPNAGKSSLLNALVGEHLAIVSPKAQATRLPVIGLRTEDGAQFIFHDLPGLLEPRYLMQEHMRAAAVAEVRRADIVLHLHPAPEAPAPDLQAVSGMERPLQAPVLTVYTKSDIASNIPSTLLADGIAVSAVTRSGLDELLDHVREKLPVRPFEFDPDDLGTQPLRFFVVEYLREAAFELLAEEVPYSFTAEVEEFREHTDPVYIRVHLYVERESQKAILIGRGGRTIKSLGSHARSRLEILMGRTIYLDCWVKVLPRWRKDPAALKRFGFVSEEPA